MTTTEVSFADRMMSEMTKREVEAVEKYLQKVTGIPDCFDWDGQTNYVGLDNPSINDRISFFRSLRELLEDWRVALCDLRGEFWGDGSRSNAFDLYVEQESYIYEHDVWYFAQHALAEMTGAPVIRRLAG